ALLLRKRACMRHGAVDREGLGMLSQADADTNLAQCPLLATHMHPKRDGGARCQARQHEFERPRACIRAALRRRLIRLPRMLPSSQRHAVIGHLLPKIAVTCAGAVMD